MEKMLQEWEESGEITGFEIPTRSKRGPRIAKSADNPHKVAEPGQGYLLSEVELTLPEQAVQQLKQMFPGLDVSNWEQALRTGVMQALAGCSAVGIDMQRLVFFPWVKRSALARLHGVSEGTHYGKLLEKAVFPQLERLYKEKYNLGFWNPRAGAMSEARFLQMKPEVETWITEREKEVSGDICFSGAILDMFHGHSVISSRYEVENNYPNLALGTSYVVMQMLLTQSQLQTKWQELHFDCGGDLYDTDGNSSFSSALGARVVDGGELRFGCAHAADAHTPGYGGVVFPRAV